MSKEAAQSREDFTLSTVDLPFIQNLVESLLAAVAEYQEWVAEHGFSSLPTAEALLNSVFDGHLDLERWVDIHEHWMEQAQTMHTDLCYVVEILADAAKRIAESVPNDPDVQDTKVGFLRLSPKMDTFSFSPVVVSQLQLAARKIGDLIGSNGADTREPPTLTPGEAAREFRLWVARHQRTAERDSLILKLFPEGIGPYEQEKVVERIRRHCSEVSRDELLKMNPAQLAVYLQRVWELEQPGAKQAEQLQGESEGQNKAAIEPEQSGEDEPTTPPKKSWWSDTDPPFDGEYSWGPLEGPATHLARWVEMRYSTFTGRNGKQFWVRQIRPRWFKIWFAVERDYTQAKGRRTAEQQDGNLK